MAKSTSRKRLQTYHAKDIASQEHNSVLLSNTSKRLRKVVTSVPVLTSHHSHTPKSDGDDGAGIIVDEGMDFHEIMDFHPDTNTDVTSCADFEHPAALRIRTRAKRYQNSVCGLYILLLLESTISPSLGHPPPHMERVSRPVP